VSCPLVLLRSEHGILGPRRIEEIQQRLGDCIRIVELPAAGHHPMLDQPLLLIGAIRTALALGLTDIREWSGA
jgi:pimeloyl-ACP methyl ester carboxylesterase